MSVINPKGQQTKFTHIPWSCWMPLFNLLIFQLILHLKKNSLQTIDRTIIIYLNKSLWNLCRLTHMYARVLWQKETLIVGKTW
jgi:hypothetical protein